MDNNQTIPEEVQPYLEGLLADAGITPVDDAMKEGMMKDLYVRLDNFLASAILDNMPADQVEAFIQLNEKKATKEEIDGFLQKHLPSAQDVFAKAFVEFRDLYLGNTALVNHAPSEK